MTVKDDNIKTIPNMKDNPAAATEMDEMRDGFEFFRDSIIENMFEGVMIISFDGKITYMNPAALGVLGLDKEQVVGKAFATVFLEEPENDEFVQLVLDTVYEKPDVKDKIVPFYSHGKKNLLRMIASIYRRNGKNLGMVIVISDLSDLMDFRDAVKSLQIIQDLNNKLEIRNKLLDETFGRFLSDEIVRQLLDTPDGLALGGKKRDLTIMMSDLRGFTALSERMPAEDLITMLNHYLGEMTDVIQGHGGTIIEFIGDGIMAIFGAPAPSETHAADAIAAALAMEDRMDSINNWNLERDYPALEMGIGLNTGEVIVGNIGSEKRTKYGVVGSNVNLCGRIESYTVGGQVLIAPYTRETAEKSGIDLEIANEMTVYPKGAKGKLILSHVTGIGAPYNIYVNTGHNEPESIDKIIPVCFHKIEGKHGLAKTLYGGIKALANDRAVFETDSELAVFDNLQLDAGGKLFCKVMEEKEGSYLLQYTSVPAGYERWIKEQMDAK